MKNKKRKGWLVPLGGLLVGYGLFRNKSSNGTVARAANVGGFLSPNTSLPISGSVSFGGGNAIAQTPAPTGVVATTQASPLSNFLSWNAFSGATSYTVRRATSANGTFTSIATGVTSPAFTDSSATAGQQYFYQIIATTSTGNSGLSSGLGIMTATSSTGGGSVPNAPSGVAAATQASPLQNTISWAATNGASSYIVQRSTTANGTFTSLVSGLNSTNYIDNSVTAGTQYFYRVLATNLNGNSAVSSTANITTATGTTTTASTIATIGYLNNPSWNSPAANRTAVIKYIGTKPGQNNFNGSRFMDLTLGATPDPDLHKITIARSGGNTAGFSSLFVNETLLTSGNTFFVRTGDQVQVAWLYSNNSFLGSMHQGSVDSAVLVFNVTKNN